MADGNGVGVDAVFGVMPSAFHVIYTYTLGLCQTMYACPAITGGDVA